jgi:hypothetical protein
MESWVVGYDGDDDVERHASPGPEGAEATVAKEGPSLRIREVSDYI